MTARSYTSAGVLPAKILHNEALVRSIMHSEVFPAHVQLYPTNRCNLKCPWCSCSARDLREEWGEGTHERVVGILADLGTKAVTISGGGEPPLYPKINELIELLTEEDIKIGLVSNGLTLDRLERRTIRNLTWIRISFSDTRAFNDGFTSGLDRLDGCGVDRAFSYVLTRQPDWINLENTIRIAASRRFTHVRIVSDILDSDVTMAQARERIEPFARGLNYSDRVIYQDRSTFTRGFSPCWISLLKPVIAADEYVYPCCGAQYALAGQTNGLPKSMRMGHYSALPEILERQQAFDGSRCAKCYYAGYQDVISALLDRPEHREFV